jgi:nucleotide-binding universal stress UspA family protein
MPTTVLRISAPADETKEGTPEIADEERALRSAAKAAKAAAGESDGSRAVDVTTRVPDSEPEQVVAREARKGHDFLMIGVENTVGKRGFDPEVNRLALGFEGPFAIVLARGTHVDRPLHSSLSILVPTSGTEASRRASEVAIALARANRAPVTALYVASGKPGKSKSRALREMARTRQQEEAILKDVADIADRYDVSLRTAMRTDDTPEAAILREARAHRHNLIVIGVSRRPGDTLFFGNLAEALLERSDRSLLFVSSGGVSTAPQGRGHEKAQEDKARRARESEPA